jgi:hypothetical protein
MDNANCRVAHTRPQAAHPRLKYAPSGIDNCPAGLTRFACPITFEKLRKTLPLRGQKNQKQLQFA